MSTLRMLLILAAGYDLEIAKSCTSVEQNKMAKHGTLVIIPAIVGSFSMYYALYLISKNIQISILGGLIWGVIIFFIDRSIVSLNRPGTFNLGLLGRFLLAMVIGFVVAEPVVLLTFQDSIQENLKIEFIAKKDAVINKYKPTFQAINSKLIDAKNSLDQKQSAYTDEMDGSGGSGRPNKGPIYEQKYADYLVELENFNKLSAKVENEISIVKSEMIDEIKSLQESQANGLLGQFRALNSIEDPEVKYATWALRLFFFFIEIIPFLIKVSRNKEGDLYYDIKDGLNKIQLENINSNNVYKKEVMSKEEQSLNLDKLLKINRENTIKISKANNESISLITKEIFNSSENILKQKYRVIKSMKNKKVRDHLLKKIDQVYAGYLKNMEELIEKSNQFYSDHL